MKMESPAMTKRSKKKMHITKINANPKPVVKKALGLNNSSSISPSIVFRVNKANIYASSFRARALSTLEWALIINADGSTPKVPKIALLHGAPAWAEYTPHHYPEVVIEWPDYGVANLPRAYWQQLAEGLSKIEGNVLLHCTAGKGRTGTMLAILAALTDALPEGMCPVTWIRKRYDEDACETSAQLDYVEIITGRMVTAQETYLPKSYGTAAAWQKADSVNTTGNSPGTATTGAKAQPVTTVAKTNSPPPVPGRYANGAETIGGTYYGTEIAKVEFLGKVVYVDTSKLDDDEYSIWASTSQLPLEYVSENLLTEEEAGTDSDIDDDDEGVFDV
jgi:protein-tyrosine phosphatase